MLRIDTHSSRELQAVLLSIRRAEKTYQAQIRQQTKPLVQNTWQKALAEHADTLLAHRVLVDSARVSVSNQNVRLKSGGLARKLRGGARTHEISRQAEFGAPLRTIKYTATKRGKSYPVSRTSGAQFKHENRKGWVVYPAAASIIPRLAALWTQTVVRTMHEAFERKS
ncbi:hypothetical protein FB468_0574 [Leucobacter komagatae]|uniref:HK97 gp10 family phage protein n=1 Tax=Leucobacter komagatae TaxID=55969 RepID=A0A542Y3C7_9MICO|nr:hypothetical protein [Leucobacter komagatae]TQL42572.1 hypothetical protein FB468_0574 [Leucobacter komagatae]